MSDPNNDPNNGNAPNEEENRKAPKSWLDPNIDPQKLREDIINKAREIQEIAASDELLDDPEVDKLMAMNGLGKQWIHDKELIRKGIELADEAAKLPPPKNPEDEKKQFRDFAERIILIETSGLSPKAQKQYLIRLICGAESLLGREVDADIVDCLQHESIGELMDKALEMSNRVTDEKLIPSLNDDFVSPLQQEITPFPVNDPESIAAAQYVLLSPCEITPVLHGMLASLGKANKAAVRLENLSSILTCIAAGAVALGCTIAGVSAVGTPGEDGLPGIPPDPVSAGHILLATAIIAAAFGLGALITHLWAKRKQKKIEQKKQEIDKLLSAPRIHTLPEGRKAKEQDVRANDPKP